MADRTEREKLVEAVRARFEKGNHPEKCWEIDATAPRYWCDGCLALAAADLLSEQGEPDCYLVEIQRLDGEWVRAPRPFGTDPRFNDRREAMAEAEAYRVDGIPVRVRALYPGPMPDRHDRNPEECAPGAMEARGYER